MLSKLKIGTFEFIEKKIRSNSSGTKFGKDFEWLCKYFLKNSPTYKNLFKNIWLWDEWPERIGIDKGIDLVTKTKDNKYWAIQAKAIAPERDIPKRELDSFLSESSRKKFSHRLIIATTNGIGFNARETLNAQEKGISIVLRSDLLNAPIVWPTSIGKESKKIQIKPKSPFPHQKKAINDVHKGLKKSNRCQVIMACGTGKTLVALWIKEKFKSKRTLVLVPSLSIISQIISEWQVNYKEPFNFCVVCSDETVISPKKDSAISSTIELGVPVTTDPKIIRDFLKKGTKQKVVFSTYQSSDRIALAQKGNCPAFDLAIADEAHRCTGTSDGIFTTILDETRIKAEKRLFMTATPRYYSGRLKKAAEEVDLEVLSMDDPGKFGQVVHRLSFSKAIDNNLLTDYQVSVICITNSEIKQLIEEARIVKTDKEVKTDARTLASHIGLAKAIKKYDIKKIISFHSTVAKAKAFANRETKDSFLGTLNSLPRTATPKGGFWAEHVSGMMPSGKRITILDTLRYLENDKRGLISNCACLSEGVDVPALDGVAFIDPKRSVVDIIQAIGRVIRKAEKKEIGTIVIPVFVDENEDPEKILESSSFEPVWAVIRALRAHDEGLADVLDSLRIKLEQRDDLTKRIKLPDKLKIDIPTKIDVAKFQKVLGIITVERTTTKWDAMFKMLLDFKTIFGHTNVSLKEKKPWTELAIWVHRIRADKRYGVLNTEREKQLNSIGFNWKIEGQTLDDTTGLFMEKEIVEKNRIYKHCTI